MKEAGADNEKIRLATGWFRSANDGEWRYEIDDSGMRLNVGAVKDGRATLGELAEHPALFNAYPKMRNIKVEFDPQLKALGAYDGGRNTVTLGFKPEDLGRPESKKTLLHEIQHAIQKAEGFARGGGVADFARESGGLSPEENYMRLAGETEARNAADRGDFGPERRQSDAPYGVGADKDAIVRFRDDIVFQENPEYIRQYNAVKADIEAHPEKYRDVEGRLLAPNGKPSNLDERQYIQVRTRAFKKWFGDWERSSNDPLPFVDIPADMFTFDTKDTATLRQWLIEKFQNEEFEVKDDGHLVLMTAGGIKSSLKSRNKHREAFGKLGEIIENSVYWDYELSDGQPKHAHLKGQYTYLCAIRIDGKDYLASIKIDDPKSDDRGHFKGLSLQKIKTEPSRYAGSSETNDSTGSLPQMAPSTINIAQAIEIVKRPVSKVVDENGEPLVVWHRSSNAGFSAFKTISGSDFGAHFGTSKAADEIKYKNGSHGELLAAYLNIRNPLKLPDLSSPDLYRYVSSRINDPKEGFKDNREYRDLEEKDREIRKKLPAERDYETRSELCQRYLKSLGADGVVYKNDAEDVGGLSYIVFEPTQIKSATGNTGAFDGAEPDIRHQSSPSSPRGSRTAAKGRYLIKMFENADNSTLTHELSHTFLDDMIRFVEGGQATARMRADLDAALAWAGFKREVVGAFKPP